MEVPLALKLEMPRMGMSFIGEKMYSMHHEVIPFMAGQLPCSQRLISLFIGSVLNKERRNNGNH